MVQSVNVGRARLDNNGRIVIPAAMREALQLSPGDDLAIRLDPSAGELRLMSARHAINQAQKAVRRYVAPNRSLVEELLAERRSEAERE